MIAKVHAVYKCFQVCGGKMYLIYIYIPDHIRRGNHQELQQKQPFQHNLMTLY